VAALVWSDTVLDEAQRTHLLVRDRLAALDVPGGLELTGAASVPGLLTKGDIDLHLRVDEDRFAEVVDRLRSVYLPASPHAWAATLAVFDVPGERETGLAVTPVGSEHDVRFTRAWARLREDPALVRAYNELKRQTFGGPDHEARKSDFFTRLAQDLPHPTDG
jgi:GrpB-like predicted nucleotidyltransferase (UPF0157 family)